MQVRPSIVIGLGSTGKYTVANVQKFLYEVLNGQPLDLVHCMVLETDPSAAHDPSLPADARVNPISIKVDNVSAAIRSLKQGLGDRFTWCPDTLIIDGPGAGNKRAGGRLMLFSNMHNIQSALQSAIGSVRAAADQVGPTQQINALLQQRGLAPEQNVAPEPNPVVYVVGTLAGGTCSGACVDLGYLIHRVHPNATRIGIFTITDDNANSAYQANCWAALKDLAHFVRKPNDYDAAWLNLAQQPVEYGRQHDPAKPYDYIYLLSTRDQNDGQHLEHENGPTSPLLVMAGLFIAADLLGLENLRHARLVNIGQHVGGDRLHETLFTMNLRGVCYPKYEITEAAACSIIADRICGGWLDRERYFIAGKQVHLEDETAKKTGREAWNAMLPSVWQSLRAGAPTGDLVEQINNGQLEDVAKTLNREFGIDGEATIYRMVQQHIRGRLSDLQIAIRSKFAHVLSSNQNLLFGQYFLEGVAEEIRRTRKYWAGLGVPSATAGQDMRASWQGELRELVDRFIIRQRSGLVRFVFARPMLVEDEISEIQARLEMFLMDAALDDLEKWITSDLGGHITVVRNVLQTLQNKASGRVASIKGDLGDTRGPLLKICRSQQEDFAKEIQSLGGRDPQIPGSQFVSYDGVFSGLLPFQSPPAADFDQQLFFELKNRIQPMLLQQLEHDGAIDIVQQITSQGVVGNAVQRAKAASRLSVPLTVAAATDPQTVPAYALSKTHQVAQNLMQVLREMQRDTPSFEPKALPLFDHMALFYQEGANLDLDKLSHKVSFKSAYEQAKQRDEAVIDPLRQLTTRPAAENVGASGE
jgi:hypothetical protein